MNISELISKLRSIESKHGDLDVFLSEDSIFEVAHVEVEADPDNYPRSFNMPDKWVTISN
jgi:hypothetical protein